jgi:CRISPR-associated endonuclease/helicase Cas3
MPTLFAKSQPSETLVEHTGNCLSVLESMRNLMSFLPEVAMETSFFEHLFYAVALHDLGKGASGFQVQLCGGSRWNYRHEILSAGFATGLNVPVEFQQAIGLAIMTHHKDIKELEKYRSFPYHDPGYKVWQMKMSEMETNWSDIMQVQIQIEKWFWDSNCLFRPISSLEQLVNAYKDFLLPYLDNLEDREYTALHGTYGMLLRGCLIACDHLASAGETQIMQALEEMQTQLCIEIERKGRHFQGWQPFQETCGYTCGDLMISAPTGSGKTEAALLWTQANENESLGRRIFYVLPYVASINAMYKRLEALVSEDRLSLLHGKANYFIYRYLADQGEIPEQAKEKTSQRQNLARKLCHPYKVLTPFQLLKAFFGIRGFEMQFAEMSGGLFIFDEIHAYDPHTTALILTMVEQLHKNYSALFCIMTATMPSFLKQMFAEVLEKTTAVDMPLEQRDEYTRHKLHLLDGGILDAIPDIKERLERRERVMIVCNTVRQSQLIFEQLRDFESNAGLLHGRFILRDRERIESKLANYNLLVGTQAVEVSLDMDFDVLFSEPAPIDAMIQRFGRVNRSRRFETADVFIFLNGSEHDKYIYPPERISKTLDAFRDVDVLYESQIQSLIDTVYGDGYNDKEQKEFDTARRVFSELDIVPFKEDDSGRDEFEGLFKSIEVVPSKYEEEFMNRLMAKEFYEAMAYITSISERQFARLFKEGQLYKQERQWFIKANYDPERGLLLDELGGNIL